MIALPENAKFFQARLVENGPFVGVATFYGPPLVDGEYLDRSPRHQALIRGETTARVILMGDDIPVEIHGVFLRNIQKTTKANYSYLISHAAFSTAHAPHNPDASPTEAVNFMKITSF